MLNECHAMLHTACRRSDPDAPLEQIKQYTSKVEDAIDSHMHWIRPWLPALGRFLIVVTFLEDALRWAILDIWPVVYR